MADNTYIISAVRTPVAPRMGMLAEVEAHELGIAAAGACLDRSGIAPEMVDEIIVGNIVGQGGNPARLIALGLNLDRRVAGLTIDRQCVSGLDAILLASSIIRAGEAEIVLAGGTESYSRRPICYMANQYGQDDHPFTKPPFTPWEDTDPQMYDAAASLASEYKITREQQDMWTVNSHRKAMASRQTMEPELVLPIQSAKLYDSYTRKLTLETCARAKIISGTITIANTSVEADGAAFCLVVSERIARNLEIKSARILRGCTVGGDPELPGYVPVHAINQTLHDVQLSRDKLSIVEIMEAYAAQAIVCVREVGLNKEITNICGGSLSRGHPAGASGAILAVRLFHELIKRNGFGIASLAAGGGLGTSLLLYVR